MAKNKLDLHGVKQLLGDRLYTDSIRQYLHRGVERFRYNEYRDGTFMMRGDVGKRECSLYYELRTGYTPYCTCGYYGNGFSSSMEASGRNCTERVSF